MTYDTNNIFARILRGELPCHKVYEDDHTLAFMDVMPQGDELQQLAEFFRVFGDSTRIRILYALSQSELCVCDIASLLNMGQSAISHQLRILKQMRLVKFRRDGRSVLYSLADSHIETILAQGMEHIGE